MQNTCGEDLKSLTSWRSAVSGSATCEGREDHEGGVRTCRRRLQTPSMTGFTLSSSHAVCCKRTWLAGCFQPHLKESRRCVTRARNITYFPIFSYLHVPRTTRYRSSSRWVQKVRWPRLQRWRMPLWHFNVVHNARSIKIPEKTEELTIPTPNRKWVFKNGQKIANFRL